MSQLNNALKIGGCVALTLAISACQSFGGVNREQAHVLSDNGFVKTPDGWMLGFSERLLFDHDDATIRQDTAQQIMDIGRHLKRVHITHLSVNGYTDNVGLASYNDSLSLKRAQAVADPLIQSGIPGRNLTVTGMGENHPAASNDTAEGRSQNRRVAIYVDD
jgi:outer membrane protein OmpA-like peptidoglycan-associated protein